MNINKVFLMGRLTADPELKTSPTGVSVIRFTIAISRRIKRDETDFIDCVAFRQTAEFISKYFRKGSAIIAFGSIQVDNWTDKDGKRQRSTKVVVEEVQFGEKRGGEGSSSSVMPEERRNEPVAFSNASTSDAFEDIKDVEDEDLPF
jgi:single-strand DNA-binding protein